MKPSTAAELAPSLSDALVADVYRWLENTQNRFADMRSLHGHRARMVAAIRCVSDTPQPQSASDLFLVRMKALERQRERSPEIFCRLSQTTVKWVRQPAKRPRPARPPVRMRPAFAGLKHGAIALGRQATRGIRQRVWRAVSWLNASLIEFGA
ncbi:MAG TPA: hypothetical protein VMU17_01200 [Elusimicrobiota bacterium]|nr:hypothetical protein [Elusimicrobiota bacterium]